ncbi:ATP-binding protein [Pseudoduganella sp. R-31]|uniref:magnesium chelatase subunit ChlI family protein n=1 Tax=Pseudoduganella sp. R-31 TaxID=3404060 RepID=UPI003CEF4063
MRPQRPSRNALKSIACVAPEGFEQRCNSAKGCPCGYLGHPAGLCQCTPDQILRYQSRVSGPLLDRIDMQIEVGPVPPDILQADAVGELSETIAARVHAAFERQIARQGKTNQQLTPREIDRFCKPDSSGQAVLRAAMHKLHWSARAYHRVLRVARTVADLDGQKQIGSKHVSEAINLRRALRQL